MCTSLRVEDLIRRDGGGDVEDALAPLHGGGQRGAVQHVGLEQPQVLRRPVQLHQMRVLLVT